MDMMTEPMGSESGADYAIGSWQGGRTTGTATGATQAAALAAGLTGVLAVFRGEPESPRLADEATTALPLWAEGGDIGRLFVALVTALVDGIDHAEYDVRAVQFDGLVRSDRGLTGWGYALAAPGGVVRQALTLEETLVTQEAAIVMLRSTVRRAG